MIELLSARIEVLSASSLYIYSIQLVPAYYNVALDCSTMLCPAHDRVPYRPLCHAIYRAGSIYHGTQHSYRYA